MPGQDGLAALEKIKSLNPETEVIVITGHGDQDLAQRTFDLKATKFMHKPLDTDALESILKRIEKNGALYLGLLSSNKGVMTTKSILGY
jgi:YesN/AraC family two-component response regulator